MAITRSPAYPGVSVNQAIDLVAKVYAENRTNPVDRDAAARDMGFAGMTGSSSKALADLAHYGLIEKAGKGAIRVTQRAVDILYPSSPAGRAEAFESAAFAPALFGELRAQFPDGIPSENNLRSYLMRMGFATSAIPYVLSSYRETCRIVQEAGATESHGTDQVLEPDSGQKPPKLDQNTMQTSTDPRQPAAPARIPIAPMGGSVASPQLNRVNMNIQGDKVHIDGLLDLKGLEALEKKISALKLLLAMQPEVTDTDEHAEDNPN